MNQALTRSALLLLVALALAPFARADAPAPAVDKATAEMAAKATQFLASLTPEQKAAAAFDFKDAERLNWHFIPKPRKGLNLKTMTEEQRTLAKSMLAGGLSDKGNQRVLTIMSLEQILHDMEQGKGQNKRDPELYFWSVFGQPGDKAAPWGWHVEGHHMSVNFTVAGGKAVVGAPFFMGTNPAEVRDGPRKGLRVLAEEEDAARALVKGLSADQMKKALIAKDAPKDIITAADRQVVMKKFEGVPFTDLTDAQKAALTDLINVYANRWRAEMAATDMARIAKAGIDKVHFAWAGGLEKGEPHYYRIHGPTFLIEYDNVQNNANHVHSVWRDLENDFGGDVLRKHYDAEHK